MNSPVTQRPESPGIISPTSPLEFLGFAAINALIGLVSNANPIGLVAVPLIAGSWWLYDRRRKRQSLRLRGVSLMKKLPQPAKSLILLVSTYSPRTQQVSADQAVVGIQQILAKGELQREDFEAINFFSSNQTPQLQAIEYHHNAGSLREIWLLCSPDSELTLKLLKRYVGWKYGDAIEVNSKPPVAEYDYEQVFQTCDQIFRQSNYKEEVMIADITGGTKMMSVAIAMACVAPKRRMQYVDMAGGLPVVLDVDPIFYQE
jgi:hypothetical protein